VRMRLLPVARRRVIRVVVTRVVVVCVLVCHLLSVTGFSPRVARASLR
jgi:hypothetical protein